MMKKFLSLILCSILLLSCASIAFADAEKVQLKLHFWFDGTDLADWQAIVDEFEEANPNVEVTLESTSWGDYWTKLQTQATSNSIADVYGMVSMYSADYMENGLAYNMSELAANDPDFIGFDSYYQAIMSAYEKDGSYFFLPYDMSTMLLLVNVDLLEKCGLEYKPEGYTKDEFLDLAKTLKENGYYAVSSIGKTDWAYYDIMTRSGCTIIDENGLLNLDNDKVIETTQFYADLMAEGYASYAADATDYFASGMSAMTLSNPEGVANKAAELGAHLDVIRMLPTEVEGGEVIAEGGSFGIYAKTEHPQEAWALVKALTGPEASIRKVAGSFRGVPTVNDPAATEAFLQSDRGVEHAQFFLDMLEDSTRADYPNRTKIESEMKTYLELIYAGDMTAADGLREFQEIADELMAE